MMDEQEFKSEISEKTASILVKVGAVSSDRKDTWVDGSSWDKVSMNSKCR